MVKIGESNMESEMISAKLQCAILVVVSTQCLMLSCMTSQKPTQPEIYPFAKFKPVELHDARIIDGFWKPYIDTSRDVGMMDYLRKFEAHGNIDNFRIVTQNREENHTGDSNNNEFVYKLMEAAGYYANNSRPVKKAFEALNATVLAAQDDDGYLNTFYQNPLVVKHGVRKRFEPNGRFEFYDFGHLTQAGIAWYRTTGDDRVLDGMIKFADLLVDKFGAPNKLPYNARPGAHLKYEHPNHEMAMVELYRVTGDRRYLEFAKHTLDTYGFWEFPEIHGHSVQETLLLTGGADVYLEYGDQRMLESLLRFWNDMRDRKMYITGGLGSTPVSEAYGKAYELPNNTAYAETCASISSVFWNYRMLLATGDAKYADCMERNLYNATLVGISQTGTEYFYRNVLHFDPEIPLNKMDGTRQPWFKTSCCQGNVHRLFGSLQQYIYTHNKEGVQVHLYTGSELTANLPSGTAITLTQQTDYPRNGHVELHVTPEHDVQFALRLRIPGWVRATGNSDDLYTAQNPTPNASVSIQVNGSVIHYSEENGYAIIDREWSAGDVVTLDIPMEVRRMKTHEIVENNRGRIAIQRGPIVYCAEAIDNGGNTLQIALPHNAEFQTEFHNELLGGINVISTINQQNKPVTLIPYHAWANRTPGEMIVWMSDDEQ
jgi:uncharacterized protein